MELKYHASGWLSVVIGALALSQIMGCAPARWTTVMRTYDAKNTSIAIDAKQRVVLSGAPHVTDDAKRVLPVVCAEPSPDALSALATSSGLSLSKEEKASLASNLALSEAAGSIGLRTQSIQLMRDAMYRLCEGYMSGAIDAMAFETLQRRFQSSMVAILAIEQITGAVRASTVLLGVQSQSGDPETVAKLTEATEKRLQAFNQAEAAAQVAASEHESAKTHLDALNARKAELTKSAPAAGAPEATELAELPDKIKKAEEGEKTKAQAAAAARKTSEDAKDVYDIYEAARRSAIAGGVSASSVAQVLPAEIRVPSSSVDNVADSVTAIVGQTLNLPFGRELCTTVLLRHAEVAGETDAAVQHRARYWTAVTDRQELERKMAQFLEILGDAKQERERDNLKSAIAVAIRNEDMARKELLKTSSVVASCLLYLDASSMALQSERETSNIEAQTRRTLAEYVLFSAQRDAKAGRATSTDLDELARQIAKPAGSGVNSHKIQPFQKGFNPME